MRVDLAKFLMIGLEEDRRHFFQEAQKRGIIHFIDPNPLGLKDIPQDIHDVITAIKVLRGLPPMEQDETREYALADGFVTKILQLHQDLHKLAEAERVTNLEIVRVEAFGDFSHEDIAYIEQVSHRVVQFFVAKSGAAEKEDLPEGLIFLKSEHGLEYFLAINPEPVQYEDFSEMRIEKTSSELKKQLASIKKEIHDIEQRLKEYAKYNDFLHRTLRVKLNTYHLHAAENYTTKPLEGYLFSVTGWVPVDKIDQLNNLAGKTNVHVEQVAIDPKDKIPTFLENEGYEKIGEDLVNIYDTPSSTDKDPSFWVVTCFSIFFAMIIGDAAYGAIFLLIALFIRYKYPALKGGSYRFWKLMLILSFACMFWGVMAASYFGFELDPHNPLRKISLVNYLVEKKAAYHFAQHDDVYQAYVKEFPQLKQAKTADEFLHNATVIENKEIKHPMYFKFHDNVLFELALLVGVTHIIISLLRYVKRNWSAIGWVIFIIGGYLYIPHYLNATSIIHFTFNVPKSFAEDGLYLVVGGISLAFILGLIQHRLKGFHDIMTVIQIFADTLSYLRIYALALAGAMVAETVNEFAGGTIFIVGALLFVIGHITNIALGIMGGVIHGLRLNFIEWYHYSFEGGGKKFNPLRLLEKENGEEQKK